MAALVVVAGFATAAVARAATWQLSAGPTLYDGGAVEVSRRSGRWEVALGYVGEQSVLVRHVTPICPWAGAPAAACSEDVRRADESVDPFGYLSVQRRFEFAGWRGLRPVFGLGLVTQTGTNAYVSSAVNFSLAAGLEFSERLSLQWRHFSNAGLDGPNLGQDLIQLRWALR